MQGRRTLVTEHRVHKETKENPYSGSCCWEIRSLRKPPRWSGGLQMSLSYHTCRCHAFSSIGAELDRLQGMNGWMNKEAYALCY